MQRSSSGGPLRGPLLKIAAIALAVVNCFVLDQLVKKIAIARWSGGDGPPSCQPVVDGFFELTYLENRGAAFGIFQDNVAPLALFSLAAFAFVVWKRRDLFGCSRIGLVAEIFLYSGLFGNLYDRLARGFVVDMFHMHWRESFDFPVFNVADVYITCAGAILVWLFFRETIESKRKARSDRA